VLKGEIRRIYEENYEAFGARKMHVMLNRSEAAAHHGAGHVARCTVERLMRAMSISGIRRAKRLFAFEGVGVVGGVGRVVAG